MLHEWFYLIIFLSLALLIPAVAIGLAGILSPKKPNKIKQSTYECGVETVGTSHVQFKAQYYIYGLIFLIFDVELIFLYPWAVVVKKMGMVALVEIVVFLFILFMGFLYAHKKGALKWM